MAGRGSSSDEDRWQGPAILRHADLHGDDAPEEGEVVPGYHSDADTEEYYNRHSSPSDSDETVSDSNAAACSVPAPASCCYGDVTSPYYSVAASHGDAAGASSAAANSNGGCKASSSKAAATAALACPVCGKEFRSQKAVCSHMKVHQQRVAVGSSQEEKGIGKGKGKGIKRDVAAIVGSWGGTGKRGCSGLGTRATSTPNSAESDQSMGAIVVAEPQIVFQPMPLAFATPNLSSVTLASVSPTQSSVPMASASPNLSPQPVASAMTNVSDQSSSAEPMMHNDAMDTVVAEAAANPLGEVAPPAEGDEQAPSVPQQPMAHPPPAAVELALPADQQPLPIAPRPRQNPNGYTCDECSVWFPTHQGLGGHVAGHRNREHAAGMPPGDGAAAASHRGARPEKEHACKVCGAVFPAGVQLGGHMRKHYAGPPIVPNKRPRLVGTIQPLLPPPDLTLALSIAADEASPPAPAVEAAAAVQPAGPEPAVEGTPEAVSAPAVPGRVLLFGIDIGVAVKKQKPAAQEGPSAIESGSESTGGEQ